MGGLFSSSKSNSVTNITDNTKNVSGVASAEENYGTILSGVNDSTIHVVNTDYGALNLANNLASNALSSNSKALDSALGFAGNVVGSSNKLANNALLSNTAVTENALGFAGGTVGAALESNTAVTESALGFAGGTVGAVLESNNSALEGALESNVITSNNAMTILSAMAGQQSATTQSAIAMANASKAREQTGATESDNNTIKTVSMMMFACLAIVFFGVSK